MRTVGGEQPPSDTSGSSSWDPDSLDQLNLAVFPGMTPDQIVECWRKNYNNNYLSSKQFREYWRYRMPSLFSPSMNCDCLHINFDEEEVKRTLLDPLELFICGRDPKAVFKELSDLDNPLHYVERFLRWESLHTVAGIWGHHMGPFYKEDCKEVEKVLCRATKNLLWLQHLPYAERVMKTCLPSMEYRRGRDDLIQLYKSQHKLEEVHIDRDCGTDPTCVLCIDCFKRSAHKQHRYKLSMSVGGGYCDCGDPEAWKSEAFCENHSKGQEAAEGGREKLMARMPADIMDRAKVVLSTVLKYAYQILTSELTMSLPQDLQIQDLEHQNIRMTEDDVYCTLLFNDETHTFEQVIDTLKRAIDCSQKEAIDYATAIDREGRCIVKCSNFASCNHVRLVIERQTSRQPTNPKPLKVVVMPAYVMAHQIGSMKLLSWLQQLLGCCEAFRILFSDIAMEAPGKEMSVVEGILNFDTQLWKSARSLWHHLFVSGLLMDFENKKRFAKIFTKYYNVMMKDFINDDHDHSYSVSSLSVQLFTVPSISHHLISVDDVLAILLRFFTSECERRRNDEGKLSFERTSNTLRRAMYVLYDLKYLLSSKPEVWNEGLRRGFLHGFDLLVNLLMWMQGMDATKRQVGQHMEYEPEWEFAFNLHFKLAPVLSLIVDWCGTDKIVLTKVYRTILKKLGQCLEPEMKNRTKLCEVANHSVMCIDYDVSSRPVSIHLPLSRIFAGLSLLLSKFGLDFYGFENVDSKPDPVQIIEPVLRTQVMVAQVQAGMWRRNGYSLINQIYFYKNVKCRTEMFDRDVTLLQVGASLIEPNDFLIHLLNKFDLVDWAQKNYERTTALKAQDEDATRQTTVLVEEFLNLIIQIVGERHVPGIGEVTQEDQTAKEIIHQLCIESMPHSALNKALPEDTSHETHIESVIDKIARFKKPGHGTSKGVYELKEEFFDNFDVFFYHYTREEMSKAEEAQIKRRKAAGLEVCCPPPKLPPFTPAFRQISNILQSDVMLHIFQTVFERTADLRAKTFSETQFHMVLHLIGYALHEEVSFTTGENPIGYHFTDRAHKYQLLVTMEKLKGNARIDTHKVLLDWTIRKYKEVLASKGVGGAVGTVPEDMAVDTDEARAEEEEKKRKAKIAAARKAAIMAQMAAAQKTFIMEHKDEFETASGMKSGFGSMESMMDVAEEAPPVAFGPDQTVRIERDKKPRPRPSSSYDVEKAEFLCPLCQCLSNAVIPVLPPLTASSSKRGSSFESTQLSFQEWLQAIDLVTQSLVWQEPEKPKDEDDVIDIKRFDPDVICGFEKALVMVGRADVLPDADPQSTSKISVDRGVSDMMQLFFQSILTIGYDETINNAHPRLAVAICQAASYTFVSTQNFQTSESKGLFELSSRQLDTLSSLARCLTYLPHLFAGMESQEKVCNVLWSLANVMCCEAKQDPKALENHFYGALETLMQHEKSQTIPIDKLDPFSILVTLLIGSSTVTRSGRRGQRIFSVMDLYFVKMAFALQIIQSLLVLQVPTAEESMEEEEEMETVTAGQVVLLELYRKARRQECTCTARRLVQELETCCKTFLRCVALFGQFFSEVAVPGEMKEYGGDSIPTLLRFIGLESIEGVVQADWFQSYFDRCLRKRTVEKCPLRYPVRGRSLIDLPSDYSELINDVANFTCPNSDGDESRTPTRCLLCGVMLCSQSYCCQMELDGNLVGACTHHAHFCGAGVGIFLRVRECRVLLLAGQSKGCYMPPPYLDKYGETDQGMKRGDPLHLCEASYRKWQRLWLSHSVQEHISHAMETSQSLLQTDWHHV